MSLLMGKEENHEDCEEEADLDVVETYESPLVNYKVRATCDYSFLRKDVTERVDPSIE